MAFCNSLDDYLLHESSIDDIVLENNCIALVFKRGFYDKKHNQLSNCKIIIEINSFQDYSADSFATIWKYVYRRKSRKGKLISWSELKKALNRDEFIVDSHFCSEFEKAILILGRISKYEIELKITDIDSLKVDFC